jgi:hypothetical protein
MYNEPIPYIDGFSMISSFPQVSFFMSSWGMDSYLSNNEPIFRNILIKKKPKLLLANTEVIDLSLDYKNAKSVRGQSLLITDWLCLKANFINHWGIIYVPGKEFSFIKNGDQFDFEILIPDKYTIEAPQPVIIDDIYYNPYDTIHLEFGFHKIKSDCSGNVILRIGNKLYRPQQTPVLRNDLYSYFG